MRTVLTLLAVLSLAGCGSKQTTQAFLKRITPPQDDRLARDVIQNIRTGNFAPVAKMLDRRIFGNQAEQLLPKLREYIDPNEPKTVELVGANVQTMGDRRVVGLRYQLEFPSSWYMVEVTLRAMGTSRQVIGLRAYRLTASLEEINAFTLRGKGLRHWLVLSAGIAIPLFMVATLILCIASRIRLKWLWILFLLFGFGKLGLNWTSGQFLFNPLSLNVQLLGTGIVRGSWCDPWILSVSVPVGGIIFLLRRKALIASRARRDAAVAAAAAAGPPVLSPSPPTEDDT